MLIITYSVADLINKRNNHKFVPLSSIRTLNDEFNFKCTDCGTILHGTGHQFLIRKTCPMCAQRNREDKFLRQFRETHKDNILDYILIGFSKHFVIMKHHTEWCNRTFILSYKDYYQNCPTCYAGSVWDVNKHFIKTHNLHEGVRLIKYHNRKCQFYCDRCKSTFYKWRNELDINCPKCDSKVLYKKLIKTINKYVKPFQLRKDKCNKYAKYTPNDFKVIYSFKRKAYFIGHKCLDNHYRFRRITEKTFKHTKYYHCPFCKHIQQVNKVKDNLRKYNPDYVLVSKYTNYLTPIILKNIKYNYFIVKKYTPRNFRKKFKKVVLLDNYSRNNYLQVKLNRLYGKNTYIVRSYNDKKKEATLTHTICKRTYKYNINSLLSFDIRCQYCQRSLGEQIIISVLDSLKIEYISSAIIGAQRDRYDLHYDFLLPHSKVLIEYDGAQHYQPISKMGGVKAFKRRNVNDNIKTLYAQQHGYHLLRINYKVRKFDDIKKIILDYCSRLPK